jgi:hypothetical protein
MTVAQALERRFWKLGVAVEKGSGPQTSSAQWSMPSACAWCISLATFVGHWPGTFETIPRAGEHREHAINRNSPYDLCCTATRDTVRCGPSEDEWCTQASNESLTL